MECSSRVWNELQTQSFWHVFSWERDLRNATHISHPFRSKSFGAVLIKVSQLKTKQNWEPNTATTAEQNVSESVSIVFSWIQSHEEIKLNWSSILNRSMLLQSCRWYLLTISSGCGKNHYVLIHHNSLSIRLTSLFQGYNFICKARREKIAFKNMVADCSPDLRIQHLQHSLCCLTKKYGQESIHINMSKRK